MNHFNAEEQKEIKKRMVGRLSEDFINLYGSKLVLENFQKEWMSGESRLTVTNKSRRIGFSFIKALEKLIRAQSLSNYTCQFISYNQDDAKEKIKVAREAYEFIPKHLRKELKTDSKTALEFVDAGEKTVSRFLPWPCKPPRGKEGDLVLDEFAHFDQDVDIYTAGLPVITGGNQLDIGSTPLGNKNLFAYIYNNRDDGYSDFTRSYVPWWLSSRLCIDTLNAGLEAPILDTAERVRQFGTPELQLIYKNMPQDFKQEYEGEFVDESTAFITLKMINECVPNDPEISEFHTVDEFIARYDIEEMGDVYLGFDVGRLDHKSELTILTEKNDIATVRAAISLDRMRFEYQEDLLTKLLSISAVKGLGIDRTGLGMSLAERLMYKFGPGKVTSYHFTTDIKSILSNNTYLAFEKGRVRLPRNRDLIAQIHSIKKSITPSKNVKYDVSKGTKGHHGDKYWALAMAITLAGGRNNSLYDFYNQEVMAMRVSAKAEATSQDGRAIEVDPESVMNKEKFLLNLGQHYGMDNETTKRLNNIGLVSPHYGDY